MKKKWIIAQGLAFEEEQEKLRLEKLAQEGWLFEKIALSGLCWVLVQGEPQFRQYEFDYLPADQAEQQEYLQWMEEAGWHLPSVKVRSRCSGQLKSSRRFIRMRLRNWPPMPR